MKRVNTVHADGRLINENIWKTLTKFMTSINQISEEKKRRMLPDVFLINIDKYCIL